MSLASRAGVIAALVFGGASAAALALLTFAGHGAGNVDDAFILMVYVRNLLEHGRIEWNVGEGALDGCTSLLDLLLKAGVARSSGADIFQVTLWTTLACSVVAGWIALGIGFLAGSTRRERLGLGIVAAWLIASSPALADSAAYLLEGPLFAACGLAAIAIATAPGAFSRPRVAALLLAACCVVVARPEGLVLASGVVVATLALRRHELGGHSLAVAAGTFVLVVLAYLGWRIGHFGHWAPNTYYAKTSASRMNEVRDGAAYVLGYLGTAIGATQLLPLVSVTSALLSRSWRSEAGRQAFGLTGLAGLGMLLLVVWSGGDIYGGGRFLNVPAAFALAGLVLGAAYAVGALRLVFLAAILVVGAVQLPSSLERPREAVAYLLGLRDSSPVTSCDHAVAMRLARTGVSVGQTDFQRLKFLAPAIRVIDFSGLNDREIAHQPIAGPVREGKFTLAAVVRRQPDVFVWGAAFWSRTPLTQRSIQELASDPELTSAVVGAKEVTLTLTLSGAALAAAYVPASLGICRTSEGYFNVLVRRDVASRLERVGFTIGR